MGVIGRSIILETTSTVVLSSGRPRFYQKGWKEVF